VGIKKTILEIDELKSICKNVAVKMVCTQSEYVGIKIQNPPKLIFPTKREAIIRKSEQEARVFFCNELESINNKGMYYSIETPTIEKYSFKEKENLSNKKGQSARFDLTIFFEKNKKVERSVNIEFKNTNSDDFSIKKDILKLISENQSGIFFHILHSIDSGTFKNNRKTIGTGVFNKYIRGIKECNWDSKKEQKYLLFTIILLRYKIILFKIFEKKNLKDIDNFFRLDYKVKKGQIKFNNTHGWQVENL